MADTKKRKTTSDKQVKHRKVKEYGITRKQFHSIIQKAAQPTKRKANPKKS